MNDYTIQKLADVGLIVNQKYDYGAISRKEYLEGLKHLYIITNILTK